MLVNKKRFCLLCLSIIYTTILFFISNEKLMITSFVMGVSLIMGVMFVYDCQRSPFTLQNMFFIVFFGIGFYFRYLLIQIMPDTFLKFAPIPLTDTPSFHLKTALVLLMVIAVMSLAMNTRGKYKIGFFDRICTEENLFDMSWVRLLYWLLLLVSIGYKFANATLATNAAFGRYDNLFSSILVVAQLLAYSALALFVKKRRIKHLIYYLAYFVPIIVLSIIEMWKGTLLFETVILCIAFHKELKGVNKRYILSCLLVIFLVFPIISMSRDNIRYNAGYDISISNIISYNKEHNVFISLSERMAYYDETYYCLNTLEADINAYQEAAGGIVARFFSGLIPRAIWKNKPVVNSGQYVTYILLHYPANIYNNLSIGMISDCFVSYSYIGICIVFFVFTKLLVALEMFRNKYDSPYVQGVYLTFSSVLFTFMEGDIASKSLSLVVVILAMTLLKIIIGFKRIQEKVSE